MGINLSMCGRFKPKRRPAEKALDRLRDALGSYADVGIHNGQVYFDASDIGSYGSNAITEFIQTWAKDFGVVDGDCDDGHFEEIICPPHVEQWRAEIAWRQERIKALTEEIMNIALAQGKAK